MPFRIFRVKSAAELDSAPVALIAGYPLEKRDYKPYAQCNLCLGEGALLLRMWAFEVSPPRGSELRAVLYLFPDKPDTALQIVVEPEEQCTFFLIESGDTRQVPPPEGFALKPFSGEDLQGVYWGGLAAMPLDWLESMGRTALEAGATFPGNFYKLCPGPEMAHQGSSFPADFTGNPFGRESMGELVAMSR